MDVTLIVDQRTGIIIELDYQVQSKPANFATLMPKKPDTIKFTKEELVALKKKDISFT